MNKITSNVAALIMAFGATLSFNSQTLAQSKYYYLRAKHSGQCLNVLDSGRDNGDNVVQGDECSSDNFQWALIPAGYGYYYIRAKHSGQCLNVLDSGRDNGDNVVQGDECSSDNFQWALLRADSEYYYLRAKHSGQCLNVLDSGRDNGDNVVQGDECSSNNFQWATIPASSSFSSPSGPYDSGDRSDDRQEQLERQLRILQDRQRRY